ncbi:MAG TPA: M23 family metallopeptidase [Iamia sp.]|nr:M23 family metallopeptidase [Iamia sp.]
MADNLTKFMAGIRQIESSGNYDAIGPQTRYGRATGAYQFLDSTWDGYKGFRRAVDAPNSVQDDRARALMGQYYARFKRWDLVAIAWHAGPGSAARVQQDPSYLDRLGDGLSRTGDYVRRALSEAGLRATSGRGTSGGSDRGRRSSRRPRRRPWALPPNTVDGEGRLTVDTDRLYGLARKLTMHMAVLESVRRHSASVRDDLEGIVLEDRADARQIREAIDTALSDEYGVGRARNLMIRDIGYVVEARERALGADRTDRDHRRVIERLIATLTPGATTVATRRKVRGLLRGLYEPARSTAPRGGSPGAGGLAKPVAAPLTRTSEFGLVDGEGAPDDRGVRHHAGKDWFAPGGTAVSSPVSGTVVDVQASRGNTGQVFGGVVRVRAANGEIWVFRHVDPSIRAGTKVDAGDRIARITRWAGGPSHTHIELWKTRNGDSYDFENMIDPMTRLRRFL